MPVPSLPSRLLAEFVGTFTLIAAGVGVLFNAPDNLLAVAFAHGLAIAVMVTAVGHVSGGHFNPAVSTAMVVLKKIRPMDWALYVVAQLAGAVAAAALIKVLFEDVWADSVATVRLAEGVSPGMAVGLEALGTFFLVWVIFAVAIDADGAFGKVAGMPIGFTIVLDILMFGPLTGAAMNPARWFGPNLITGEWADSLVWIAGPVVGALLAGALYMYGIKPRAASVE